VGLLLGRVGHVARLRVEPPGSDLGWGLGGGLGQHGQILAGELTRLPREHGPHLVGNFIHFDAAIQDQAKLILLIQECALDRALLRIRVADPIQEGSLPLPKITRVRG